MKSSEKSYRIFVEDMITSIDRILNYVEEAASMEQFLANQMMIDAIVRNFEIIGEAAKKVPDEIKDRYSEVPWNQMYGLRNIAAHDYGSVDTALLWEIIQNHLVSNRISLEEILSEK